MEISATIQRIIFKYESSGRAGGFSVAGPLKGPATVRIKNNNPDAIHSYIGFGKNKEQLRVKHSRNSQSLTASPGEPGELPVTLGALDANNVICIQQ